MLDKVSNAYIPLSLIFRKSENTFVGIFKELYEHEMNIKLFKIILQFSAINFEIFKFVTKSINDERNTNFF